MKKRNIALFYFLMISSFVGIVFSIYSAYMDFEAFFRYLRLFLTYNVEAAKHSLKEQMLHYLLMSIRDIFYLISSCGLFALSFLHLKKRISYKIRYTYEEYKAKMDARKAEKKKAKIEKLKAEIEKQEKGE